MNGFLEGAESELEFYKEHSESPRGDDLFEMEQFGTNGVIWGSSARKRTYCVVCPNLFQRSYCFLLYLQKKLRTREFRSPELFLVYHSLEEPERPFVSLNEQYEIIKKGVRTLGKKYPDERFTIHEVMWFAEDPGAGYKPVWDEEAVMDEAVAAYEQEEQNRAMKNSRLRRRGIREIKPTPFSQAGWKEGFLGQMYHSEYMVDIHFGQRWEWLMWEYQDTEYPEIDYPRQLGSGITDISASLRRKIRFMLKGIRYKLSGINLGHGYDV